MSITVRPVGYDDQPAYTRLGGEAFGVPDGGRAVPSREEWAAAGFREWGAFDGDELTARLRVYGFTSWFHGAPVSTAGIAGVAVEPERRGSGHLARLFAAALTEAREGGETVSTLYPTAPGIYRRLGYEVIGSFDDVDVPLQNLARVPAPDGVVTRRAGVADFDAVVGVHRAWAARQNGPISRAEKPFWTPPEKFFADYTGVTLAVDAAGEVVGFASWIRGEGYTPATAVMEVDDLIALTPDAARALWRTIGSFSTVVGTARVSTSGLDPAWLVLPDLTSTVHAAHPYMLRILDVAGALGGIESPLEGARVPFAVRGPADLAGAWTLSVADGVTHLEHDPVAVDDAHHERPVLTANGLALLYAGAQSAANLRLAGHLAGPDGYDAVLGALFAGRQVHVRDYF
ncbi:enhanced intracellular survival protein Eis [Promicromonospora thailandica]|uniref:Acetyltransferase n=1 Tax=Promicromonospora thailandica TaxID=765201 RepID=A0A9X2G942_9MICO|nr:GNAT family N-acetyltransferase [Promicromonospora thailandica]MCP2264231.1 putative acetyltransferase [Promicromonospora thailandica]BFF21092.1 GNAT family N-acetyltransferase [Promicromonospora thailandica]